jgi:hypothetical protein
MFGRKKQIQVNTYERRMSFDTAQTLARFIQDKDATLRVVGVEQYSYKDTDVVPPQQGRAYRINVNWLDTGPYTTGVIERPSQYVPTLRDY